MTKTEATKLARMISNLPQVKRVGLTAVAVKTTRGLYEAHVPMAHCPDTPAIFTSLLQFIQFADFFDITLPDYPRGVEVGQSDSRGLSTANRG